MTQTADRGHFLRLPTILAETNLSRATIYRMIRRGDFPRQAQLSERCKGWWAADFEEWKQKRRSETGPP